MSQIEISPGTTLSVEDRGSPGARATAVFLHGLPVNGRMFGRQVAALTAVGIRCLTVDLRGFGRSATVPGPYDFDIWADDLAALFAALSLQQVLLVGYSFGGAIAMHYMARHGQLRVKRLALLAATAPCMGLRPDNPHGVPPEAYTGLAALARQDAGAFNTQIAQYTFHQAMPAEVGRSLWELGMEASPEATARGMEELRDRDLRGNPGAIGVPTLICHGAHDQAVPWALGPELQARLIPQARIVRFEESGHGLFAEEAERLNAELTAFIA